MCQISKLLTTSLPPYVYMTIISSLLSCRCLTSIIELIYSISLKYMWSFALGVLIINSVASPLNNVDQYGAALINSSFNAFKLKVRNLYSIL